MSDHIDGHRIHVNSLRSFSESQDCLGRRARECYGVLAQSLRPMTDREVMRALGYQDMNAVRPRLTELLDDLWLEEVGTTEDELTGKQVRLLRAVPAWRRSQRIAAILEEQRNPQLELAFA